MVRANHDDQLRTKCKMFLTCWRWRLRVVDKVIAALTAHEVAAFLDARYVTGKPLRHRE